MIPIRTKRLHWRSALLTVLRLRKTGGLVENEVLEALKITLRPPSSSVSPASPELISKIRSYVSSDETIDMCKTQHESIVEMKASPIAEGYWNCMYMRQYYLDVSDRRLPECYGVMDPSPLISPRIKQRGRQYRVHIATHFTVQYGENVPYRMCAISQSRHPGALSISGPELLSLLLLAIKCHENAPKEPVYTVRVFAVDSFSVRRLSARVPSAYICALLQTAKKATGGEPVGEIIIEQTRYFDMSNHRETEGLLTALLEDDDKIVEPYDSGSDSDLDWFNVDRVGLRPFMDEYERQQREMNQEQT